MLAMRLAIPSIKSCPIRSRDKKPEMLGMLGMRPPNQPTNQRTNPPTNQPISEPGLSPEPGLIKKKHRFQVLTSNKIPSSKSRVLFGVTQIGGIPNPIPKSIVGHYTNNTHTRTFGWDNNTNNYIICTPCMHIFV